MSPIEWYYARGNKQTGPVSSIDLKRLATAGELRPDDLVWREGLAEWALARSVRGLFEEEGKPANAEDASSRAVVALSRGVEAAQPPGTSATAPGMPAWHLLDVLLDSLRVRFDAHFVETTARIFRICGSYGLLAAMALTALFTLVVTMKTRSLGSLLSGVVLLLLLVVLHYAAGKFCDALERLNRAGAGSLVSTALPDCVAMLSLLAGLGGLLGSVAAVVELSTYSAILPGIVAFMIGSYLAFVALNPVTLNISVVAGELAVGEESLGAVTFLVKAVLRVTPVVFGMGVICGTLLMGLACYQAISNAADPAVYALATQLPASAARITLISSAALPLAAYLLFLLYSLLLDLCRAILILPSKVDELATLDEENETGP